MKALSLLGRSTAAPCRLAGARGQRRPLHVVNMYDPEGLFKGQSVQEGIIERRMRQKLAEQDKKFAAAMMRAKDETEKEILTRRESRRPPEDTYELIEFLLNTPADDMEFEVARCRPRFTAEFFKVLDTLIGNERFAANPDKERLDELDLLRKYIEDTSKAVDVAVSKMTTAAERMKKLLTAKDKKQIILDMAANNEIDQALLLLLQQNIDAARAAEQEDAAKFMEKVKAAAAKYAVKK